MLTGLVVDDTGFAMVADGLRSGVRRSHDAAGAELLDGLASRYQEAVRAGADDGVFLRIGRELFGWLDDGRNRLATLLRQAPAPLTFEVRGPRAPAERAWALMRAPFEVLARPGGGFLAEEGFGVARRLGRPEPAPAPDGFRLGLAFMASSPRGQVELDFEAEEAAILGAVGDTRLDLLVEDTGDPRRLGHRLAELGGLPVVHLSCHGANSASAPVLLMEDELGDGRPTTAAELVTLVRKVPRLLFVSACLTATSPTAVAHSMATELVAAGVPAVLGWDGSVGDDAATRFAGELYRSLADRADLAGAVADARRVLLRSADRRIRTDWHLARLWLGPAGGGPLVAGTRGRTLVPAVHGTRTFLDRKRHVPVATADMFVGRRTELQRASRALRSGERAGVLLHGPGRFGKSSLAARIADRFPDLAVAVVFGDYSAAAVLTALADACGPGEPGRQLIADRLPDVRERPAALEPVLTELLSRARILLIIDDLEQILRPDPAGPHRVCAGHEPVLAAVLRAFDPARTAARLLITSRYLFGLPGLDNRLTAIQLPPLSDVARRKLLRRQQALVPAGRVAERAGLARRAVTVSRGNAGLQDLICLRLVYGDQVSTERAEAAVAGMEAYLRRGDLPSDTDVRAFLENLAVEHLLAQAEPAHLALLRALTLFDVPVPPPVTAVLAGRLGATTDRLRGLGLVDVFPDAYHPHRPAIAANDVAAGRLDPLTEDEERDLAGSVVEPLLNAWGGRAPRRDRALILDLELARLALLGDNSVAVGECAAGAVALLGAGLAADAYRFGQDAVALLDRHRRPVPTSLLREVADAARTTGDGQAVGALLSRWRESSKDGADPLDHAQATFFSAAHLVTGGELGRAEELLAEAHGLFTAAGAELQAAMTMAAVADIALLREDLGEAIRIHLTIALPVYERLGEERLIALTWNRIAELHSAAGQFDQALRIHRERALPVFERLGDTWWAVAVWRDIAEVHAERGEYDQALHIYRKVALPLYERLGNAPEAARTWGLVADIHALRDDEDEALRIHREIEIPVYERLGDASATAGTWRTIAQIHFFRDEFDEAIRVNREQTLPIYEGLGDHRATAATLSDIAEALAERGDHDEALSILRDGRLPLCERLGDAMEVSLTLNEMADILDAKGDRRAAAALQQHRLRRAEDGGDADHLAFVQYSVALFERGRGRRKRAVALLGEAFEAHVRLGQNGGIVLVGEVLGELLCETGQFDDARRVLGTALEAVPGTDSGRRAEKTGRLQSLLADLPDPRHRRRFFS